ncbi:MAG: M56 family metallopeptidase [Hungatella sp.]|nr:M56 family metallopeptidase [Hungatella sp.]
MAYVENGGFSGQRRQDHAMIQNLLFMMSLSGTVVFVFYLAIYPVARRYFSIRWRYGILKMAMAFYLIPFSLCKYELRGFLRNHSAFLREKLDYMLIASAVDYDYLIILNQGVVRMSEKVQIMVAGMVVVGSISFVIMGREAVQYWKVKEKRISSWGYAADQEKEELFVKLKDRLKVKRKVRLICSEYCGSPLTCGVVRPVVLFPVWDEKHKMDVRDVEYVFRHELIHIRHNDVLVKWICVLLMAVHWFNPFVYLLFREISCIGEMYCDSTVMEGKGEEERKKYADLILRSAVSKGHLNRFGAGIRTESRKKMYKRRILEMKQTRKHKVFLSAVVAVLIGMVGGMTALAYTKPVVLINEINDDNGTELTFTTEPRKYEKLVSDHFFTADDGAVYDLSGMGENDRATCMHDYSIPGIISKHEKDGAGCIIKDYEAAKCSKCGGIKLIRLISTLSYVSCPH